MANIPFLNNAYFAAKVGIGTESPGGKLDVKDGNSAMRFQEYLNGASLFLDGSNGDFVGGDYFNISAYGATDLAFGYGAVTKMVMKSSGNVGIGTTSPDTNLEIESSTGGVLRLTSSDTTVLTGESIGKIEFKSNDASTGGDNVMGFIDSVATNVGTRYALSFGTGDAAAAVERMRIDNLGAVRFNDYGAGTLVTDASGNITAEGGAWDGPFLPLAGGTLSGNLTMDDSDVVFKHTDGSNYYRVGIGASANFEIYNTNYGRTDLLITQSTGNATFVGDVTIPEYIYHTGDANTRFGFSSNDNFLVETGGINMFGVNATTVFLKHTGNNKLITTSTGVTVTGAATATTFLGDLDGTINTATLATTQVDSVDNDTVATTAYVNNKIQLIPAGLVFQGTWNASTNTPTLTSGSGTTGNFYIVSVAGSTNLDGITDWKVGDWAVFIEQGASDQWEKIDNSSVLDGIGTGQTLPLWSGSGTSNTLTNSKLVQNTAGTLITAFTNSTGNTGNFITNSEGGGEVGLTVQSRTNRAKLRVADNDSNAYVVAEAGKAFFGTSANGDAANITVLTSGNVGIGTDDPDEKLEIAGSLLLANNSDIKFNNSAGNKISTIRYNSSNQLIIANGNSPNGDIHFQSDVTSGLMMILDGATDYVGIGNNTSPKSMLDVQGGIKMADDTDTASATKVGTMRYRTGTEYVEVDGVELITNGDFATDSGWTKGTGVTITGGKAVFASSTSNSPSLYQDALSINKTYKVTFEVLNYSSGTITIWSGGDQNSGSNTTFNSNGVKTVYIPTTSTANGNIIFGSYAIAGNFSIDNVSVMEVTEEDASYADMCMQTGASTYEWVNIVRNTY